jgi:iron complex outermembrane receptor protein
MDFNAAQNRYLSLFNTETATPGYALLNLAAGATVHQSQKSNWQFQLQVNNVLDAVYQSNMSRLKYFEYYQQSPNSRSGIYSMGRNLCAKIIFSF